MRISHVVENLNRGGLERVVIELVRGQTARGHHCQVVCLFERGNLAAELDAAGIPVLSCDKRDGADPRAAWRLRQALRRHGTQVLHTHNPVPHYYAVAASLGLGVDRVINTRHGMGDVRAGSRHERLFHHAVRRTDLVVAVCDTARAKFIDYGTVPADKMVTVPNGIHATRFRSADRQARRELAGRLGLPPDTALIGFVGRLNWAKDLETLVRAFARVRAERDDVALVLVGEGGKRADVEAAIAETGVGDRTFMLGDRGDVPELLVAFDLFAMSSVSEGYSIALLEASACALPIVTTRVGGNAEIVADGVTGRIVPPRDPEALARALLTLLADPGHARALGLAGREWVLANGTVETMVSRYLQIYGQPAS